MKPPIFVTGCARSGTSGVYMITCANTGKKYIGSSVNVGKRLNDHVKQLREGTHCNSYLQRAWNKYGEDSFKLSVVLCCDKKNLLFYEQRAIDVFQAHKSCKGYNICPNARSRYGAKFTEESKQRLSASRKGKYVGEQNHNYGKPMKAVVRRKISESLMGRFRGEQSPSYGRHHSEETRRKIGEAGKGRPAWNKGLSADTDKRVRKYAESQKGKVIPEEQREQIRATLTGYKHTEEAKKNMSKGQREKAWDSEERREKVRERGKSEERKQVLKAAVRKRWEATGAREKASNESMGANNPFYGKTHTPEAIEKMRAANVGKIVSQETREKMRMAAKRSWEKRRKAHE